jgi:hypothetical protein
MIVKKVKRDPEVRPKSKAWQIGDLVDYIRQPHNMNPEEKSNTPEAGIFSPKPTPSKGGK